jgi:hypothetical protein
VFKVGGIKDFLWLMSVDMKNPPTFLLLVKYYLRVTFVQNVGDTLVMNIFRKWINKKGGE